MGHECLLPCSQGSTTNPYPRHFIRSSSLESSIILDPHRCLFAFKFSYRNLVCVFFCHMPAHQIIFLLSHPNNIWRGEQIMEHLVMNVSQSPVTSFHLGVSIFLSTLFSKIYWLRDAPTSLTFNNLRSAHTVFMCFVFIWEQTATCATYCLNWLVFITEMKSVYSAVGTGSLNKAVCASSLKGCMVSGLHRNKSPVKSIRLNN
jgi:hypothetical protein